MKQTKRMIAIGGALAGALVLAGCAGGAGPRSATLSDGKGCKALDRKMRGLLAKGQGESQRYRELLNIYLRRNCHRTS